MLPKSSPYAHLLEDETFRRWYENAERGSVTYARVCFRRIGNVCREYGIKPADLASKNPKEVTSFLLDVVSMLEARGNAGSLIESYLKAIKSWLTFNDIVVTKKIRIPYTPNRMDLVLSRLVRLSHDYDERGYSGIVDFNVSSGSPGSILAIAKAFARTAGSPKVTAEHVKASVRSRSKRSFRREPIFPRSFRSQTPMSSTASRHAIPEQGAKNGSASRSGAPAGEMFPAEKCREVPLEYRQNSNPGY